MALVKTEQLKAQMEGFSRTPLVRQLGLLVGLAASVALGVGVVLWSQAPSYKLLYGDLSEADASEVMRALQQHGIEYRLEERTGAIMVPSRDLHAARLKMASTGLPKSGGVGYELLEQEHGFRTSELMENARYQRALEGELAHTIASLANVQGVRVHLALPKRTAFIRAREKPSASVLVNLYPGRTLEAGQVQAITHLVSSSVPNLELGRVTVVDQYGHLLSSRDQEQGLDRSIAQLDYTRRVEEAYTRRVEDILTPVLGAGRVRAQVVADVDFDVVEATEETFHPNREALRSEQVSEQRDEGSSVAAGIPGALTNKPPAPGTVVAPGQDDGGSAPLPVSTSRNATRNFEIDRTIRHVRSPVGSVRRLSVAVVVDDTVSAAPGEKPEVQPLSEERLAGLTRLVKEAVGFSDERGDSVHIMNASFQSAAELDPIPEQPLWEQPWIWDLLKQLAGIIGVLLLVFGVLRPVMRTLAEKGVASGQPALAGAGPQAALPGPESELGEDQLTLGAPQQAGQLSAPAAYEKHLSRAEALVGQDPKLVARVVKDWLDDDA